MMIRKILSYIAVLILLLGLLGFFLNGLISMELFDYKGELPIVGVQGIIEQEGKIYIGLEEYNRVQVYDNLGHYMGYNKVENHGKAYDFSIDNYGIPVITVIYVRYKSPVDFIQSNGDQFRIESQFPLIIEKKEVYSIKKNIITQPWYASLWAGSIHSWLMGLCGLVIFIAVNIQIILEMGGINGSKEEKIKLFFKKVFKL